MCFAGGRGKKVSERGVYLLLVLFYREWLVGGGLFAA